MRTAGMTFDDYISNQRDLIQHFQQLSEKDDLKWQSKEKEFTFHINQNGNLETTINVPSRLTPPKNVQNLSRINYSDIIKIQFINSEIEPIEGKISEIIKGQITAVFDTLLSEENQKNSNHLCIAEIFRSKVSFSRQLDSLTKLKFLNENLRKILCGVYPTKQMTPSIDLFLTKGYEFNESQKKAIVMAVSNPFSLIQGPPGTGKTHTIGAIAIQALRQNPNKKILICGTTNVSINSLLEIVGDMVQVAGCKACWLTGSMYEYTSEEKVTKEQKLTTFYLSRHMNAPQSQKLNRLCNKEKKNRREMNELRTLRTKLEQQIIQESNILFSTLDTICRYPIENIGTLIVDEATLSVESSMIIPLSLLPDRLVLVGDPKQLAPLPLYKELVKKGYYYSMFERIINEKKCLKNTVMLNTQYRMHPDISHLPNHLFYNDELIDGVSKDDRKIEKSFVDTYKIQSHLNFINFEREEDEFNLVFKFVKALINSGIDESQIGVISSANKKQAEFISQEFEKCCINVKVTTVDSFQGSQRDYIIINAINDYKDKLGFLYDERRINVAITRAKRMVTIFGNAEMLMKSKCWESVIEYTKNKNSYFEKLPIVFDDPNMSSIDNDQTKKKVKQLKSEFREEETNVGYKLREIKSEISESNVRVLWPDEKEDIKYFKEWVQKRVDILNDKKFVTLAYDAEGICMQFGDIFDNDIDYYNWKSNNIEIPKIKTNESIIISFYKHSDDFGLDKTLVNIMKPLLEHPRITLITFDFTFDLDKFYNFGINIKTNQIIDAQLMNLPKSLNKNNDLICSTGWSSIANIIIQSNENNVNENMISRAKKSIKNNKKKFPHEENIFLIDKFKYPPICQFTKIFLEYSAGDIFYTAIVGIEVLSKGMLDNVKERSIEKLKKFTDYRMKYGCVSEIRSACYASESFSSVTQAHFSKESRTYQILNYYKKLNSFVSVLDKCPIIMNELIPSFTEEDSINIRKRHEEIVKILMNQKHLKNIKKNAILTHIPTFNKNREKIKRQKIEINDQQKANTCISTKNEKTQSNQVQSLINMNNKQNLNKNDLIFRPKQSHSSNIRHNKQQQKYQIETMVIARIKPEPPIEKNYDKQDEKAIVKPKIPKTPNPRNPRTRRAKNKNESRENSQDNNIFILKLQLSEDEMIDE